MNEQLDLIDRTDPVNSHVDLCGYINRIGALPLEDKVDAINAIRAMLHEISPFKTEPVDFVKWVKSDLVHSNDYNPNSVAPPEMELLRKSIDADGYTQPIVSMIDEDSTHEVIDGFHRHRVGKECKDITARIKGYLPVVMIRESQADKTNRMASTIRHNRARGKHKVSAMSDIVIELKRRNWTNEKICRELGMDDDEILRLCQITGLAELFSDQQFSAAWDTIGDITEADFIELTDNTDEFMDEVEGTRTVNTSDEDRIFHTYEKWECYKAGFYESSHPSMTKAECEKKYAEFLADIPSFSTALDHITSSWKHSCEHYLTNSSMNRIAWLGQAAVCFAHGVPSSYRGGFFLLNAMQQIAANECALKYLNIWLEANGRERVSLAVAYSGDRQSDIY